MPRERVSPSLPLLHIDAELADALGRGSTADLPDLMAPVRTLVRGRWAPSPQLRSTLCLLVVDGLILRTAERDGLKCVSLYGRGDLIDMARPSGRESWTVRSETTLAAFDARIVSQARDHPQLHVALLRRIQAGQRQGDVMAAIARLSRVRDRVLALLRHLGGRWGKPSSSGICLDLPLTHAEIGGLIGAQRPTVSLAISQLEADGMLSREGSGRWIVAPAQ